SQNDGKRFANPSKVAPNPIPFISETTPSTTVSSSTTSRTLKYVPEHNNAWEAVPPIPLPEDDTPAASNEPNTGTAATNPSRSTPSENLKTHVVQSGDTLSGIAQKYLGSSARFEEIYEANRDLLKNPNDLRVGMKLKIPPRERTADVAPLPIDGP